MKKYVVCFMQGNELAGIKVSVDKDENLVRAFYKMVEAGQVPGFNASVGIVSADRIS